MIWRKYILISATLMTLILAALVFGPGAHIEDMKEPANILATTPLEIPFHHPFTINGLSATGSWQGKGFGQVWLVGNGKKHLLLDTDQLEPGQKHFENLCEETCSISPTSADRLVILVTGGALTIKEFTLAVPMEPAGMAYCPDCKRVSQKQAPDHSLFMLILILFVGVVAAHALSHTCKTNTVRNIVTALLIAAFVTLTSIFGLSIAAPTAAVSVIARQGASVIAALAVLMLFAIGAFEIRRASKEVDPEKDVWRALKEAEDEWERKK